MANKDKNRDQQGGQGKKKDAQESHVGNQQGATQTGGQNRGGRNRDQSDSGTTRENQDQNTGNRGGNR